MPAALSAKTQHPSARPARSVQATWMVTLGSIVFILVVLDATLLIVASEYFASKYDVVSGLLLLSLLTAVVSQIRYCWFLRAGLGGGLPALTWTLLLLIPAVTVGILGLFSSYSSLMFSLPLWLAICILACLLPNRQRLLLLTAGAALTLLIPTLQGSLQGRSYGFPQEASLRLFFVYAAMLPFVFISSLWWWRLVVELDRNRLMAGELAVARERLRFAADLHDIQGHHLQVIALKSELSERLLTIDIEAAREHIHQTRLIAKQALEETRSLVSGYRETVLENELTNAREVLSAAGAHCELSVVPLPANPETHKALAMTVREATTNILRHSDATLASITLAASPDGCTLTISNNGVMNQSSASKNAGTGLAGLRARVEALGGKLETTLNAGFFELQAQVPTQAAQP